MLKFVLFKFCSKCSNKNEKKYGIQNLNGEIEKNALDVMQSDFNTH